MKRQDKATRLVDASIRKLGHDTTRTKIDTNRLCWWEMLVTVAPLPFDEREATASS
jgi:hypothetical protein